MTVMNQACTSSVRGSVWERSNCVCCRSAKLRLRHTVTFRSFYARLDLLASNSSVHASFTRAVYEANLQCRYEPCIVPLPLVYMREANPDGCIVAVRLRLRLRHTTIPTHISHTLRCPCWIKHRSSCSESVWEQPIRIVAARSMFCSTPSLLSQIKSVAITCARTLAVKLHLLSQYARGFDCDTPQASCTSHTQAY